MTAISTAPRLVDEPLVWYALHLKQPTQEVIVVVELSSCGLVTQTAIFTLEWNHHGERLSLGVDVNYLSNEERPFSRNESNSKVE